MKSWERVLMTVLTIVVISAIAVVVTVLLGY